MAKPRLSGKRILSLGAKPTKTEETETSPLRTLNWNPELRHPPQPPYSNSLTINSVLTCELENGVDLSVRELLNPGSTWEYLSSSAYGYGVHNSHSMIPLLLSKGVLALKQKHEQEKEKEQFGIKVKVQEPISLAPSNLKSGAAAKGCLEEQARLRWFYSLISMGLVVLVDRVVIAPPLGSRLKKGQRE
ncbi:hypothetical protein B296_00028266 [Ensete ventricosum]|uniref:Uncharacterized protein n=1 Tax=Ensete ventricosum TaxID=4639 RepID=A0A426YB73_ENSVE|nr:hypothetical protein B296_00028266 [Ensete ventricosum]